MQLRDQYLCYQLIGKRFTAREIAQSAVTTLQQLNNILNKSNLILISDPTGQGRAREFCLIDAYQVALYAALSRLSGNAQWSALLLNEMLFEEWITQELNARSPILIDPPKEYRGKLCADLEAAPLVYRHRDMDEPLIIFADYWSVQSRNPPLPVHLSDIDLKSHQLIGGVFVNVTANLQRVDELLDSYLRLRD